MHTFSTMIPPLLTGTETPFPADSLPATLARWTHLEHRIKRHNLRYAAADPSVHWPWVMMYEPLHALTLRSLMRKARNHRRAAQRKLRIVRRKCLMIADGMEGIGK